MEKKTYNLDINEKDTKIIRFNHNGEIYHIRTTIDFKYLKFFNKNKTNLSKKELAVACITMSNLSFETIVKDLSRGQIFFILNKYISLNNISKISITTYNQFCEQIEIYTDNIMKNMQKQLTEAIKNSIPNIKETAEQINNISKNINSIIMPTIKVAFDIKQQIQTIFQEITSVQWYEIFGKLKVALEQFEDYISEFDKLLIKVGYPPVDFDISDIKFIIDNKDSGDIYRLIDSIIIRNYDDEYIDKIFDNWKNYAFIKKRIKLFEDAIYAYKIEKYSLSIPVLLAQLEGTVAEFFNLKGKSDMRLYKKYVTDILEIDKITYDKKITKAYFMNYILDNFFYGDKIPKFSRHAILHGADVNFGTKVNSINLILTLDIIFECMDNMKKRENQ